MCLALQGPVVMGAFQGREAEKYGGIYQRLGKRGKGAGTESDRGLGVGGLPRTFKKAVRGRLIYEGPW